MRITKKNLSSQPDFEEFMNFLIEEVYSQLENDNVDDMMEDAYKLATVKNYKLWLNGDLEL
ncbi:MAG: hypothetical protein ACLR4X_11225 [Clostridia bacterium]